MTKPDKTAPPKPVLVRVPRDSYAALQLSLPFVQSTSAQQVLAVIIDEYLASLAESDLGFAHALQGLKESAALKEGVLARRAVRRGALPA